jgi:very-short-patch-repair endonuclease
LKRFRGIRRENVDAARDLRVRQTASEKRLWEFLRYRQIGSARIRRQHAIGPFVLDFYVPTAQLAIEVDGAVHDDELVEAQDAVRTEWLETHGIRVIRFRNEDIWENVGAVLTTIEHEILQRTT